MPNNVFDFGTTAYLEGGAAAVVMPSSEAFIDEKNATTVSVDPAKGSPVKTKNIEFMPFGSKNDLPIQIMKKIGENTIVGSNVEFKADLLYGDGVFVCRKVKNADGSVEFKELLPTEAKDVFDFMELVDYGRMMQEVAADLVVFADSFVGLSFGRRTKGDKYKVASMFHREMCFSRISKQNEKGRIEYHGYSSKWPDSTAPDDAVVTELLSRDRTMEDMLIRIGERIDPATGEKKPTAGNFLMMSLNKPVPGRAYYNRPYWWSIFLDWYDFSCSIPKFKKALLKNQMVLKYHVTINTSFWSKLFKDLGISGNAEKEAEARKKILTQLNDFLSGEENAGKSFVSHYSYDKINKFDEHDFIIKPLESFIKGGEYIEDSEEATNVICNTMSVHPSLKGASPGKSKTINGTEARELFIIANALCKPMRELMVKPLYLAKKVNGWDEDIHFFIANTQLTTLDKNTGAEKSIGSQKV